mgnify:FL=1
MNNDLCKEKISWYKLLFTLMSTALVACISWIVSNINYPLKVVILLNGISIVVIAMSMSAVVYKIRYYFKQLGENDA